MNKLIVAQTIFRLRFGKYVFLIQKRHEMVVDTSKCDSV